MLVMCFARSLVWIFLMLWWSDWVFCPAWEDEPHVQSLRCPCLLFTGLIPYTMNCALRKVGSMTRYLIFGIKNTEYIYHDTRSDVLREW